MHKLEADMRPLQDSNAELSEQNGMLQAEKRLLEEDIKRWKNRTQVCSSFGFYLYFLKEVEGQLLWEVLVSADCECVCVYAATAEPAER